MASRTRSDQTRSDPPAEAEPGATGPAQPRLGLVGYLRFFWRQLTSMRTALILLLLLALAAVPGSLVPQRSSDPNGVIRYQQEHPDLFPVLDGLGLFSTFSTPWFSAIYLLLFISLVGCIVPRIKHHLEALRARPPRTPQRLSRLVGFTTRDLPVEAERAVLAARDLLRRQGYRVERYGDSISAERGYLRETGNLVFHTALVGILVTVGVGGGFGYTGQRVLVQGSAFTNSLASYDSFNPGRFFQERMLEPFSMRLDAFDPSYVFDLGKGNWAPVDFDATISTREAGGDWVERHLKVNEPLDVGGTQVYLLSNGYAPILTVRDADGNVVQDDATPFIPQDANLFSIGIVKVPDGLDDQLGMRGLFYPDPTPLESGALASFSPEPNDPVVTLEVYRGDLGLDEGVAVNAYNLDIDSLELLAGRNGPSPAIELHEGDRVDLPDGLGSVEFSGLQRYVGLDIHRDGTQPWVLTFAILVLGGLLTSLFVPRRRVWVRVSGADGAVHIEYAGLARGEDAALEGAVAGIAAGHAAALGHPDEPPPYVPPGGESRMDA